MNNDTGLRSRKFWLVVGWVIISSTRMFITAWDKLAEISAAEITVFLTVTGLIASYLGVNYAVKKLGNGNANGKANR